MRAVRLSGVLLLLTSALWVAVPSGDQSQPRAVKADANTRPDLRRLQPGRRIPGAGGLETIAPTVLQEQGNRGRGNGPKRVPRERRMARGRSFDGDVRTLPQRPIRRRERPERHGPAPTPTLLAAPAAAPAPPGGGIPIMPLAAAPSTSVNFDGLDYSNWGAGHPPDTVGDVGPDHYVQAINTSIGIYDKDGGFITAFTFDTLMSQGNFGNVCDTDNFGDPVVLYDTFEDRWVITDFAFQVDNQGNVLNPPGSYECFAVSKTGNPVTGGWNFYSLEMFGGLGDYPKLGIWPDGLYMSVNMFDYAANGSFQNVFLWALNKAQMYAGEPWVQMVGFSLPPGEFSLLPSNARLQTGTPPPGAPNYFTSVWNYLNAVDVWTFHVDWNNPSATTLMGPFSSITDTQWVVASATVPSSANNLDTLRPRLMMQNQYSNIAGVESLWNVHTSGAGPPNRAGVRYYEVRVNGGSVAANATQAFTYSPDSTHRFMPSVAVDRAGNLAIGYSTSANNAHPGIRYAGRLAADPLNAITQTETVMMAGGGSQTGTMRWGDYSAMTLDPNGCTFWYTNEYYAATGLNYHTRVGAFAFPACTPVSVGALQGTVKTTGGAAIAGATVTLGSRTTTTDAGGNYAFADLAAGTYPGATAASPGFVSSTFSSIVISSGATTIRDFVLAAAPQSGCVTDTTQADFAAGTPVDCDVTGSPGSVRLSSPLAFDQFNGSVSNSGFGITTANWAGQTFTAGISGALTRVELSLFCSGCNGTTPDLTVSIRATTGSPAVPTGPDLAVGILPGFSSGAGGFFTAAFAAPATVTAGTRYAVIVRPVANPSPGIYAYLCSCDDGPGFPDSNPYANGQRVISPDSGGSWDADTVAGGRDLGFVTYVQGGYHPSGTFISSTKDANPAPGSTAAWGALTWTASTPPGTTVQFQAAASNNPNGPFFFVGPDGTSGTFFSNGASLAQFNGRRYLKYQAVMTTTSGTVTPSIEDVTVCFNNVAATSATLVPEFVFFNGKQLVGSVSPPSPAVTVTNTGPNPLIFMGFNGAPPAPGFMAGPEFPATTDCPLGPGGLAPAASCHFTFSFAPSAAGLRFGSLMIASNASSSPHTIWLGGNGFIVDDPTVTATVVSGAQRLQLLQNTDGGWFFRVGDFECFGSFTSCPNIIGNTALALLSAYNRNGDPSLLADAVEAGELLESMYIADSARRPFTQDLEFLVALSNASQDPQYETLATTWFANITTQYSNPADRVDAALSARDAQGRRSLAAWDIASMIRMAKAAGNLSYATGLAQRVIAREIDWMDQNAAHRWDQCSDPGGCGLPGNQHSYDYTLLGMGSMLWAIHDLAGFDATIDAYSAWLLSQQDAAGSWDLGDLQITAYVALGLGVAGADPAAVEEAVAFFIANQLFSSGFPFSVVNGVLGPEYTMVNSEVIRAIDLLYSTQQGQGVQVTPAQLATVSFSSVTQSGSTTLVARQSAGALPWGLKLVQGRTYDVQTSASVSGSSTVCFDGALTMGVSGARILHKEGGRFIDRTSSQNCATADSLSMFAIAQRDPDAVDSEAPALSVSLSPAVLSPPNNKMIAINAAITATDNSGETPAVTLVSITVSGDDRGKKESVSGAALGSDDRAFELRAQKRRVYTIVYRATDASGNSREVSKQISVP